MILDKQVPGNPGPLKRCPKCREEKTLDGFYSKPNGKPGSYCKTCTRIVSDRWTRENPEKHAPVWRKATLKRYNLTLAGYDDLLAAQGGVCAICKTDTPGGTGRFHVDHDHACCPEKMRSCGKCIRGLLCAYCNMHLTGVDPERLRRAADYVENFRVRTSE